MPLSQHSAECGDADAFFHAPRSMPEVAMLGYALPHRPELVDGKRFSAFSVPPLPVDRVAATFKTNDCQYQDKYRHDHKEDAKRDDALMNSTHE
jgi:hypothetical protein